METKTPQITQQQVVKKSKAALAMEYYKDNPPVRILDMRAVLR